MVNGNNDPVESFFNSLNVVKHAFTPFELGLRKAAKDFECCWSGGGGGGGGGARRNWVIGDVDGDNGGDDGGDDGEQLAMHSNGGSVGDKMNKMQMFAVKKRSGGGQFIVGDGDKKKGLSIRVPVKAFLGFFSLDCSLKSESSKRGENRKDHDGNADCKNCLQHAMSWPLIVDKFVQGFPMPFKTGKKRFQKMDDHDAKKRYMNTFGSVAELRVSGELQGNGVKRDGYKNGVVLKEEKIVSLECLLRCIFDQFVHNIQKLDQRNVRESNGNSVNSSSPPHDHMKAVADMLEGKKADVNGFLRNFMFARVGGVPSSIVGASDSMKDESEDSSNPPVGNVEEPVATPPQKLGSGILDIPLSNVERLRSSLSTVTLTELIELVPQLGRATQDYPDKKKLISVQDFFRYTESEGRRFFEELDRDGDGQVTLEDLEVAIRKRKLPKRYARDLMRRTRSHLFSKSFGWKQFLSLMEQKEATILRAYTSLCLSRSGTLQKNQIMASLKNAELPANEENAVAMMRFLNADTEDCISYGHFRNFMVLLPSERLQDDPRNIWFESATVVAVAPSMEIRAGSVLRSALAGGLACALSTSLMYPIDTIKTRVQASTLSFPEIISKVPEMGVRGLYRGSVPAILGQFSSHGLRTGIFEASKLVLINVAPNLPEIQVQSLASFCSTFLGTAVRIPCEVLKQRCQAGLFNNVGEAIVGTWNQDGPRGFFRGTGATLCREVPFYVAGMGLYAESKKLVQHLLGRELEAWETIMVGAISGGVAAVVTTPFDVMKTRMMTAPGGRSLSMSLVAFSILRKEGPLGLFKGALPRFFWIAPLGAMNFAGYELARKAMNKNVEPAT